MAKRVVRDDKIAVAGTDISHLVYAWTLRSNVNEIRSILLELHTDDEITINGRTVAEMLGEV